MNELIVAWIMAGWIMVIPWVITDAHENQPIWKHVIIAIIAGPFAWLLCAITLAAIAFTKFGRKKT